MNGFTIQISMISNINKAFGFFLKQDLNMRLSIYLILLSFSMLLFGCMEDEFTSISPDFRLREDNYLREFYEDNQLAYNFRYNGDNQIIEQIVRTTAGNEVSTLSYNGNGLISEIQSVANGRLTSQDLYYTTILGEQKIDSITFFLEGSLWGIRKMLYNDNGLIRRMMVYSAGSPVVFNDYEWEDGNMVKRTRYFPREDTTNMVRWVYHYEYDSARNPFTLVYKDVGFHLINQEPISVNNWTKLILHRYPEDVTLQRVEKSFSYINPGYPIRKRTKVINFRNQIVGELVSDFIY